MVFKNIESTPTYKKVASWAEELIKNNIYPSTIQLGKLAGLKYGCPYGGEYIRHFREKHGIKIPRFENNALNQKYNMRNQCGLECSKYHVTAFEKNVCTLHLTVKDIYGKT